MNRITTNLQEFSQQFHLHKKVGKNLSKSGDSKNDLLVIIYYSLLVINVYKTTCRVKDSHENGL
jgi:hypothetical protein